FRSRRTRLRGRTGSSNTDGQGWGRGAVSGARAARYGSSVRSAHPCAVHLRPYVRSGGRIASQAVVGRRCGQSRPSSPRHTQGQRREQYGGEQGVGSRTLEEGERVRTEEERGQPHDGEHGCQGRGDPTSPQRPPAASTARVHKDDGGDRRDQGKGGGQQDPGQVLWCRSCEVGEQGTAGDGQVGPAHQQGGGSGRPAQGTGHGHGTVLHTHLSLPPHASPTPPGEGGSRGGSQGLGHSVIGDRPYRSRAPLPPGGRRSRS